MRLKFKCQFLIIFFLVFIGLFLGCTSKKHILKNYTQEKSSIELFDEYGYTYIDKFSEGMAIAVKLDKKYLIDKTGKILFEYPYDGYKLEIYEGLLYVCKDQRCGFIDSSGAVVIPFEYYQGSFLSCNFYQVSKGGQIGVIRLPEGSFYPVDGLNMLSKVSDDKYITTVKQQKWGLISLAGDVIIPHHYNMLYPTSTGNFIAAKEGMYGLIDAQEEVIIPFIYKSISPGLFSPGLLIAKKDSFGIINEKGEVILDFNYNKIKSLPGSYFDASIDKDGYIYDNKINPVFSQVCKTTSVFNNYYICNQEASSTVFNSVDSSYTNFDYRIYQSNPNYLYKGKEKSGRLNRNLEIISDLGTVGTVLGLEIVKEENKLGIYMPDGNLMHESWYDRIKECPAQNRMILIKEGKHGLANRKGELLLPLEYPLIEPFNERYLLFYENGLKGLADYDGNVLIPSEYNYVKEFNGNIVKCKTDMETWESKYCLLNENLETLIPDTMSLIQHINGYNAPKFLFVVGDVDQSVKFYDVRSQSFSKSYVSISWDLIQPNLLIVEEESGFGLLNIGNMSYVIPPIYLSMKLSMIHHASQNEFIVVSNKNNKKGIFDLAGNSIVPLQYDDIGSISIYNENIIASKNDLFGLIDFQNNILIDFQYDKMEQFIRGECIVQKDSKYGVINIQGETLIPLIYDMVFRNEKGLRKVKLNDKEGYISSSGESVIPLVFDRILARSNNNQSIDYFLVKSGLDVFKINSKLECIEDCPNEAVLSALGIRKEIKE